MTDLEIFVPVLLVAFNRPDTTEKVFQKLREAKPKKLYVAIDGHRPEKEGEDQLVDQVKQITMNVDWECETHCKFNGSNLGAEVTVSSAVSWVLDNNEYVIVLEDDIVAPFSFFRFAQDMLIKYRNEPKISIVSGTNPLIRIEAENDYFFTRYGTSCGWATWKRAWNDFRLDEEISMDVVNKERYPTNREFNYHVKLFSYLKSKGTGNVTWDHMFYYYNMKNDLISIMPRINLCANIGIIGLHAKGVTNAHFRPVDEKFTALIHPQKVEINEKLNLLLFNKHRNPRYSLFFRIKRKLEKILRKYLK